MKKIVVLTGAGISAESGLSTFRGVNGLWDGFKVEEVASPEAYLDHPEVVHRFYNFRRSKLKEVKPNAAHYALATLMNSETMDVSLITQNVDDLHEQAGALDLYHMHGELNKARCVNCREVVEWLDELSVEDRCSNCGGALRPHVVWFGEEPLHIDVIWSLVAQADVFISVGTSGVVQPAASIALFAKVNGAHTVSINTESVHNSELFDQQIWGRATEVLPRYVNFLLFESRDHADEITDYHSSWERFCDLEFMTIRMFGGK